jgi:hypothetical protein
LLARRIEDAGHPNFFSNNSFHLLEFFPQGCTRQQFPRFARNDIASILVHRQPFLFSRSTDDKQTSKGLFLCCPPKGKFFTGDPEVLIFRLRRTFGRGNIFIKKNYALISTSTPLGKSSLLRASTVRELDV